VSETVLFWFAPPPVQWRRVLVAIAFAVIAVGIYLVLRS